MTIREKIAELIEIGVKGYAAGGLLNKDAYLDISGRVIDTIIEELPPEQKSDSQWYPEMPQGLNRQLYFIGRNQYRADLKTKLDEMKKE